MLKLFLFAVLLALAFSAHAQQARVVTTCGSVAPFGAQSAGGQAFPTMDTTGRLCLAGGSGGAAAALTHGGVRQAWIGDSRVFAFGVVEGNGETRIQARDYGAWAEAFSGCRILHDVRYTWGFSGQTAQYELTQYPLTVALNYANFDMLFIDSPGNNIDGTSNLFAANGAIPAVISMASMALANGKLVALVGMQPNGNGIANQNLQINQYNQWAQSYANATPGVYFINVYPDLNTNGATIAAYYQDFIHVNGLGAFVIGERIASTLGPIIANTRALFTPTGGGYNSVLAPFGNIVVNPVLTGTGGSKGVAGGGSSALVSGPVPTNWDVSRGEGTAAGLVMTQQAQTLGFQGVNSGYTATLTITSDAATVESFAFANYPSPAVTRIGVNTQAVIQLDYSNVVGLNRIQWANNLNGGAYQQWLEFESGDGDGAYPFPASGTLCLKTPVATVPAGTIATTPSLYLVFNPTLNAGSAGGTFKIHDPNFYYLN